MADTSSSDELKTTRGSSVFACSYLTCSKSFHKMTRLKIHLRTHTGERPYVCEFDGCSKSYARNAHLKRHVESCHGNQTTRSSQQIECPHCKTQISNAYNLKKHIKRKHEQPKYVCSVEDCGKVCISAKHLRHHEMKHSENHFYRCSYEGCDRTFPYEIKLMEHKREHEGLQCEYPECNAVLPSWSLMRKHVAVKHSCVKCDVCDREFASRSSLKAHKVIHSESRPVYECTVERCGRVYLNNRNLQAHIRSYHNSKRIPCTFEGCTRTFAFKKQMTLHLSIHDPNRPLPKKKPRKQSKTRRKVKRKFFRLPYVPGENSEKETDFAESESDVEKRLVVPAFMKQQENVADPSEKTRSFECNNNDSGVHENSAVCRCDLDNDVEVAGDIHCLSEHDVDARFHSQHGGSKNNSSRTEHFTDQYVPHETCTSDNTDISKHKLHETCQISKCCQTDFSELKDAAVKSLSSPCWTMMNGFHEGCEKRLKTVLIPVGCLDDDVEVIAEEKREMEDHSVGFSD